MSASGPGRSPWRKSSHSGNGSSCVEVAVVDSHQTAGEHTGNRYLVRDSKNTKGPVLSFTLGEWITFIHRVKGHRS